MLGLFLATTGPAEVHAEPNSQAEWNLTHIYTSDEAWRADYNAAIAACDEFTQKTNNAMSNQEQLLDLLDLASETRKLVARIYTYATLKADEDLRHLPSQQMVKKVSALQLKYTQVFSKFLTKLVSIKATDLENFIAQEPRLKNHVFFLKDITRQRKNFTLETTGTQKLDPTPDPSHMFRHIQKRVIRWPTIMLSSGTVAILDPTSFSYFRMQPDPIDRVKIFNAYWNAVKPQAPLFAKALSDYVTKQTKSANQRGYDNTLQAALSVNAIPVAVYQTMIDAADQNLTLLHRLLKLKQRLLGLGRIEYQDIQAPISEFNPYFSVSDAKSLNKKALSAFGEEYLSILDRGFKGRWMHTQPKAGKRSGAYMQDAAYDVHPYILLNFNETYRDVGSFTHEWGHAVHSVFSKRNNPFETYRYSPFLAEVTAATNQLLLQDHMIAAAKSDEEKLYYLHEALENVRVTFFYHVQLAKFEFEIHKVIAKGQPLTVKKLSALYHKILVQYLGHEKGVLNLDPKYAVTWSMVPHFYNNFHIYQYATSIAGAASIVDSFSKKPEHSIENYLDLLQAGGSDYPQNLLENAGVKLDTMQPYDALISRMVRLLDQAETVASKMGL